jgi:hypothetical protein
METSNILKINNHKGDLLAVSCLLSKFLRNLIAGKNIFCGTGGYIFSNNHMPGKDNNPHKASGFPKVNEDSKDIFIRLALCCYS